jgi:voltage-gated potassium channel
VVKVRRRRGDLDETLTAQPGYALVGVVRVPEARIGPVRAIWRRVAVALLALVIAVITVYLGRSGYTDVRGVPLSFIDCVYFATISLTTVGYGDLTPYTEFARLTNIVVLTPLRILFLVVLVGTTLQVLTERSRQGWKIQRWRSTVRNHTVVVGYGTKGKTAITAILDDDDAARKDIVVVDTNQAALDHATANDLVTVHGDATRSDVLRLAAAQHASAIIVAAGRDDTATLVTLTAREVAPNAQIVASIREAENQHLLKQSGADSVVVSSETAGRLLGVATTTPSVVEMIDDLLSPAHGFAIAERDIEPSEVGGCPRRFPDIVLGVVRDGRLLRVDAPEVDAVEAGDRLLYVRNTGK